MISSLVLANGNGFAQLSPAIEALGWTLLHFVWQGAVLGLVLAGFLGIWRQASPQIRYLAGCSALALMFLGGLATIAWQMAALKRHIIEVEKPTAKSLVALLPHVTSSSEIVGEWKPADMAATRSDSNEQDALQDHRSTKPLPSIPLSVEGRKSPVSSVSAPTIPVPQWPELLRPWLSWIVGLWALGTGVLVLRLAFGWGLIRRLRAQGERPKDPALIARLDRLRVRLGVSAPVRLLSSASATVPMVIGWMRPVVLVPAGLLTGLSASQLEAIFAHELAHIRRHDFLVNLLQNVVETLFFYHPAVWWVSRQVRTEREHCCDDLAAAMCGSALDYARALTALAELRQTSGALGLAATGGSLVGRIARQAGISSPGPRAGWPFPVLVLVTGAVIAVFAASGSGQSGNRPQIMPKQEGETIDAIVVEGNTTIPAAAILQKLETQPGRKATADQISEDLRTLIRTRWFFTVEPKYRRTDKGLVLVIAVIERPLVQSVTYFGANEITIKRVAEETGLKAGQPYDRIANKETARRLENFYHEKGYTDATVELVKGDKPEQRDVVFQIHEGVSQKVVWRYFVGNSAVSGERLAAELKPTPAYVFISGNFAPKSLDDDVAGVRKYYENLGYFDATIKPTVEYSKNRKWRYLRYTVHEGLHYKIRNFGMLGNTRFKTEDLLTTLKTHEGQYYNAFQIQKDIEKIKKKYDVLGYTDMTVEVVPRPLEQPGIVDLILRVDEDKPYYIGRVTIHIEGDHPRTKRALAYNHIDVAPGELADPAKIKKSQKKLEGAQNFKTDPNALFLRAEEHRRRLTARISRTTRVTEMPEAGPELRSVQLQRPLSRTRRIRIRSRIGNDFNMSSRPAANGTPPEQVTILTGGVTVLMEGLDQRVAGKPVGTIELSADRMVIWSRGELAGTAGREDGVVQSEDEPFDVYMEGNVVIFQGDPTNPKLMRKVRANAATFDAREKKALLLEAELEPLSKLAGSEVVAMVNGQPIFAWEIFERAFPEPLNSEGLSLLIASRNLAANQVTEAELRSLQEAAIKKYLKDYIRTRLLAQALASKLEKEQKDTIEDAIGKMFDEYVDKLKKDLKVDTRFEIEKKLRNQGTSLTSLKREFRYRLLADEYLRSTRKEFHVSREATEAYYQRHLQDYDEPERVRWQLLEIRCDRHGGREKALTVAENIAAAAKHGEDFTTLVRTYSDGARAEAGGKFSWTKLDDPQEQELADAIHKIKTGDIKPAFAEPEWSEVKLERVSAPPKERDVVAGNAEPPRPQKRDQMHFGKSLDNGGKQPWTNPASLTDPTISAPLGQLAPGEISRVLASADSFRIVRLIERRPAGRKPFDEVEPSIRKKIEDQQLDQKVSDLYDRATIESPYFPARQTQRRLTDAEKFGPPGIDYLPSWP